MRQTDTGRSNTAPHIFKMNADMARLVDLDSDGLVDIVTPGACTTSAASTSCYSPEWRRNLGVVPDLLERVETDGGSVTDIEYVAAAATFAHETVLVKGKLPAGHMVVKRVMSRALPESEPQAPSQVVELSYSNFVRDPESAEAIGFEQVSARFDATVPVGFEHLASHPITVTRQYDVRQIVGDSAVRFPLKGREKEVHVTWSVPVENWFPGGPPPEPLVYENIERMDYLVTELGSAAARVRQRSNHSGECMDGTCMWSGQDVLDFDEYGNTIESVSGNSSGCSFIDDCQVLNDGSDVQTRSGYANKSTPVWRIGLLELEEKVGYNERMGVAAQETISLRRWAYDELGRLKQEIFPAAISEGCGQPADSITTFSYQSEGLVDGISTNHNDSGLGHVAIDYDQRHLYPRQKWVDYTRYIMGSPEEQSTMSELYEYDLRNGQVLLRVDSNRQQWLTRYDSHARPTAELGPDGVVLRQHTYRDAFPALTTTRTFTDVERSYISIRHVDGNGNVFGEVEVASDMPPTRKAYHLHDGYGRVIASYMPRFLSDAGLFGPVPNEPHTEFLLDGADRTVGQLEPDGRTTIFYYEPRAVIEKDPRGLFTRRDFDWKGDLIAVVHQDFDGTTVAARHQLVRDGLGRIVRIVDADGNERELARDLRGQVVKASLPHAPGFQGTPFEMCYNLGGQLVWQQTPAGRLTQILRDELERPVVTIATHQGQNLYSLATYDEPSANAMGRLHMLYDPAGGTLFRYDAFGQLSDQRFAPSELVRDGVEALPTEFSASYVYSPQGLLKQVTFKPFADNALVAARYHRNQRGQVTELVSVSDGNEIAVVGNMIYDAFGRMVFSVQGNEGSTSRFYNPLNQWLEKLSYQDGNSQEWGAIDYTYDGNGNVLEESRTSFGSQFTLKEHTYDALDRLITSSHETPLLGLWQEGNAYSPSGNIEQTTAVPYAPTDYYYDTATNAQAVTRRTAMSPRGLATNAYNYDDDGDLTSVEFQIGRSGFVLIENNFDALGMLAQSVSGWVVDDDPPARVTSVRSMGDQRVFRKYETGLGIERVIDLFDLVEIRPDENAFVVRLPLNGTTTLEDVRDLATGQRDLARSRYVHTDLRGSVVATTGFYGPQVVTTEEAEYNAWGESINISGLPMPKHRFLDEQPDPEFGYYHFGKRVYDPGLHRWLSPDLFVLEYPETSESTGNQFNLYAYSGNQPTILRDKTGMLGGAGAATDERFLRSGVVAVSGGPETAAQIEDHVRGVRDASGEKVAATMAGAAYGAAMSNPYFAIGALGLAVSQIKSDQDANLVPVLEVGATRAAAKLLKGENASNSGAAVETPPKLTSQQAANLERFAGKFKKGIEPKVSQLEGGDVRFRAEVPGKVPGSKAVYEKTVNPSGETTAVTKTTLDPEGNIVHIKDKMK